MDFVVAENIVAASVEEDMAFVEEAAQVAAKAASM